MGSLHYITLHYKTKSKEQSPHSALLDACNPQTEVTPFLIYIQYLSLGYRNYLLLTTLTKQLLFMTSLLIGLGRRWGTVRMGSSQPNLRHASPSGQFRVTSNP
jgi:hypothetical protein